MTDNLYAKAACLGVTWSPPYYILENVVVTHLPWGTPCDQLVRHHAAEWVDEGI